MNGLNDKTMQNPTKVEKIELVLEDLGVMLELNNFINLKSLTLINVGISTIEVKKKFKKNNYLLKGLEELYNLEEM